MSKLTKEEYARLESQFIEDLRDCHPQGCEACEEVYPDLAAMCKTLREDWRMRFE